MPELPVVSQVHPREIRPKNDEFVICQTFFLLLKFFLKFSFQKVLSVLIRFEFFIVILLTHCLVLCSRALAKIAKCIPECFHYLMLSCSSRFSVCPECRRDRLAVLLLFKTFPQNKIEKSRGKNEDNPLARHSAAELYFR